MDESFWTRKQSCKFSKVDIKKWRSFFVLTDAILLKMHLQKRTNDLDNPANQKLFV